MTKFVKLVLSQEVSELCFCSELLMVDFKKQKNRLMKQVFELPLRSNQAMKPKPIEAKKVLNLILH